MLFPKQVAAAPANGTANAAANGNRPPAMTNEEFQEKVKIGNILLDNLTKSLSCASSKDTSESPSKKKQKKNNGEANSSGAGDVYNILDPSFAKTTENSSDLLPGAILSRMTLGGLVNALCGVEGGLVDTTTCIPLEDLKNESAINSARIDASIPAAGAGEAKKIEEKRNNGMEAVVETAGKLTLKHVVQMARGLHRSVAARTEMDVMATTPRRIADLLCPEITDSELRSIRRRVYDTVVLGMGTHSSAAAAALEEESKEVPVAARVAKHEVDQWKRCNTCGNNDQASFVLDRKNGDLICQSCGTVVSESIMHEGSQFRKFEGEEDRNHHGDAPNPLFSNSHNMSTTLGGVSFQTGAGIGGFGSGSKRNIENVLRNAHAYTEMNISQFGKEEKKTRIGYKDRQKKDAFYQMVHAGDALGLHEAVVQRAKEMFAGFRDDRELVQQFKGVIAACLCEAFDQLSRDGRQILKKKAGEVDGTDVTDEGDDDDAKKMSNARASRRNDLHSASLAGKGGLLLDTTVVSHGGVAGGAFNSKIDTTKGLPFETKAAATWNLDDCKNWMIEASKSIARQWSEYNQSSNTDFSVDSKTNNTAMIIPKGTRDELEGKLVEHTLKLCEFLEGEMSQKSNGKSKGLGGKLRVTTPRVADMAQLGIRWQHSYERGSGGKGGVGNSGRAVNGTKPGENQNGHSRTAGQILLLLTAKKFGNLIGDAVAGAAFHKELKALIERESAKKRLERRVEATNARLKQMNRKPWLQKRVQL